MTVQEINQVILDNKSNPDFKENDICDGYHTFDELYEFRKVYNAALFNECFKIPEVDKAKYPFDGHTGVDVIERLKAL